MNEERLLKVILAPHVSEKTSAISGAKPQYAFKVMSDATKVEIKQAIKHVFDVDVKHVTIVNTKGKATRFGRIPGRRKAWKKAYVTLAENQEISAAGVQA